jgi:hypothetical protein
MFRLSHEQLQALSSRAQDDFLKRTTSHLLDNFSAELSRHELRSNQVEELVQRGVEEAKSFGVEHEEDVRLYIECMLVVHPRFASARDTPWFGEILQREDLSGTEKMDRIHDQLVFGSHKDDRE